MSLYSSNFCAFDLKVHDYATECYCRALETQLVIANVTSSDAGVWQCRLSTVHGATKRLQLTVRVLDASLVRCPQYTVTTSKGVCGYWNI